MTERRTYKDFGDISATPTWASVWLWCDYCRVQWVGCWDNAACMCGNHQAWDELMEEQKRYGTTTT